MLAYTYDCDVQLCGCWLAFFFFSSRRRHTRLQGDWSSDVCSSDLSYAGGFDDIDAALTGTPVILRTAGLVTVRQAEVARSEERRVGKECRSRWSPYH